MTRMWRMLIVYHIHVFEVVKLFFRFFSKRAGRGWSVVVTYASKSGDI